MVKNYFLSFFTILFFSAGLLAQEIRIFKVGDFDLNGRVKTCLVITDYGRELFEFDTEGFLTRTVTQYNDTDQDITYYKYAGGQLVEKRMESYKDEVLDAATSMANFYTRDSLQPRKVMEQIISYDKEFIEQQEYLYDDEDRLVKITTSHAGGVDESTIEYASFKNESTKSYFINAILEKSVRTSERKRAGSTQKVILTKEYVDGEPNKAEEEVFDTLGKLLSSEMFEYDVVKNEFASLKKLFYSYNAEGILEKVTTRTNNSESVKEYIFQFDSNAEKNWTKQIITPDNDYSTRRITYYPEENEKQSGDSN
ncbi:MAG: hypothetical protein AAF969_05985 [Bacteroidota bacterium]